MCMALYSSEFGLCLSVRVCSVVNTFHWILAALAGVMSSASHQMYPLLLRDIPCYGVEWCHSLWSMPW